METSAINIKSNEYCEPDCEYLSSRHNCKKYKKGLAYSKCSIGGASFGATHERCSECEKDYIIAELEATEGFVPGTELWNTLVMPDMRSRSERGTVCRHWRGNNRW